MGKYIDWYLVELEGLTKTKLRGDRYHDLIRETESHLRDRTAELTASGMAEDDAELVAIEKFGRASHIAASMMARDQVPQRDGAYIALAALLLVLCGLLVTLLYGRGYQFFNYVGWLTAITLPIFVYGIIRARRILWKELTGLGVGTFLVFGAVVGTICQSGAPLLLRTDADSMIASLEKNVAHDKQVLQDFAQIRNAALNSPIGDKLRADREFSRRTAFEILIPVSSTAQQIRAQVPPAKTTYIYPKAETYTTDGYSISYGTTTDPATALSEWTSYDRVFIGSSQLGYLKYETDLLKGVKEGKGSSMWASIAANLPVFAMLFLLPLAIAIAVNVGLVAIMRFRRISSTFRRKYA